MAASRYTDKTEIFRLDRSRPGRESAFCSKTPGRAGGFCYLGIIGMMQTSGCKRGKEK
jgi:hypothetical protein